MPRMLDISRRSIRDRKVPGHLSEYEVNVPTLPQMEEVKLMDNANEKSDWEISTIDHDTSLGSLKGSVIDSQAPTPTDDRSNPTDNVILANSDASQDLQSSPDQMFNNTWFSTYISTPVRKLGQSLLGSPIPFNISTFLPNIDINDTPVILHPPTHSHLYTIPETQTSPDATMHRPSPTIIPETQCSPGDSVILHSPVIVPETQCSPDDRDIQESIISVIQDAIISGTAPSSATINNTDNVTSKKKKQKKSPGKKKQKKKKQKSLNVLELDISLTASDKLTPAQRSQPRDSPVDPTEDPPGITTLLRDSQVSYPPETQPDERLSRCQSLLIQTSGKLDELKTENTNLIKERQDLKAQLLVKELEIETLKKQPKLSKKIRNMVDKLDQLQKDYNRKCDELNTKITECNSLKDTTEREKTNKSFPQPAAGTSIQNRFNPLSEIKIRSRSIDTQTEKIQSRGDPPLPEQRPALPTLKSVRIPPLTASGPDSRSPWENGPPHRGTFGPTHRPNGDVPRRPNRDVSSFGPPNHPGRDVPPSGPSRQAVRDVPPFGPPRNPGQHGPPSGPPHRPSPDLPRRSNNRHYTENRMNLGPAQPRWAYGYGPPRKPTSVSHNTVKNVREQVSVTIIGNSNSTGLAGYIQKESVKCASYVYRGQKSDVLNSRVNFTKGQHEPSYVVLQSGDIDIRQSTVDEAAEKHENLIDTVVKIYPNSRILVTTLSNRTKYDQLKTKLNRYNERIKQKCNSIQGVTSVDCSYLTLSSDDIHYTYGSKQELIRKVLREMSCI